MKQAIRPALMGLLILVHVACMAQNTQWGQLIIKLPEGWSSNMSAGNTVYSNYNLSEAEPVSITLFKAENIKGQPDSLFSDGWKKYLNAKLTDAPAPRPRRWTTDSGIPLFTGSREVNAKGRTTFYLLGICQLSETFQAFLIQTNSAKAYREVQADWQERIMGIKWVAPKK